MIKNNTVENKLEKRDYIIFFMRSNKFSYSAIGKEVGLSKQRVQQIFNNIMKNKMDKRVLAKDYCELCGLKQEEESKIFYLHHLNKDCKNNDPINLMTLCHRCHALAHTTKREANLLDADLCLTNELWKRTRQSVTIESFIKGQQNKKYSYYKKES